MHTDVPSGLRDVKKYCFPSRINGLSATARLCQTLTQLPPTSFNFRCVPTPNLPNSTPFCAEMLLSQPGVRRAPARYTSARRLCSKDSRCGSVMPPVSQAKSFVRSNRLVLRNVPSVSTRLFAATSIFSKFSDQALRIVTLSQQQARWLGYTEVLMRPLQSTRLLAGIGL